MYLACDTTFTLTRFRTYFSLSFFSRFTLHCIETSLFQRRLRSRVVMMIPAPILEFLFHFIILAVHSTVRTLLLRCKLGRWTKQILISLVIHYIFCCCYSAAFLFFAKSSLKEEFICFHTYGFYINAFYRAVFVFIFMVLWGFSFISSLLCCCCTGVCSKLNDLEYLWHQFASFG